MTYELEGIVLEARDANETEQYVTLLTRSYGRMTALSRGAKHHKAKLTPHLQQGNVGYFKFVPRRGAGTQEQPQAPIVVGADITYRGAQLAKIPQKALALFNLLELARYVTLERVPDEFTYEYVKQLIVLLSKHSVGHAQWAFRAFEFQILKSHGYSAATITAKDAQTQINKYGTIKQLYALLMEGDVSAIIALNPPAAIHNMIETELHEAIMYHFDMPAALYEFVSLDSLMMHHRHGKTG